MPRCPPGPRCPSSLRRYGRFWTFDWGRRPCLSIQTRPPLIRPPVLRCSTTGRSSRFGIAGGLDALVRLPYGQRRCTRSTPLATRRESACSHDLHARLAGGDTSHKAVVLPRSPAVGAQELTESVTQLLQHHGSGAGPAIWMRPPSQGLAAFSIQSSAGLLGFGRPR